MFYLAFVISFAVCYLILFIIHCANLRLDRKFPWRPKWLNRLFRQITDGILLPALVDLVLISLYYVITGKADKIGEYIYYEYRRVVHFICAINLIYIIIANIIRIYVSALEQKQLSKPGNFLIRHNGAELMLNIETDIISINKEGRNIKVLTIAGHEYTKRDTISHIMEQYSGTALCQVNPSAIVNLNMLKGKLPGTRSKTLKVLFKPEFLPVLTQAQIEKLTVTREYTTSFKNEMKKILAG